MNDDPLWIIGAICGLFVLVMDFHSNFGVVRFTIPKDRRIRPECPGLASSRSPEIRYEMFHNIILQNTLRQLHKFDRDMTG